MILKRYLISLSIVAILYLFRLVWIVSDTSIYHVVWLGVKIFFVSHSMFGISYAMTLRLRDVYTERYESISNWVKIMLITVFSALLLYFYSIHMTSIWWDYSLLIGTVMIPGGMWIEAAVYERKKAHKDHIQDVIHGSTQK